jgi:uncharacterized protein YbjT (DUF2867 family)
MKVIVFGATGSVGRLAVQRLLQDGHEVTAYARRPGELGIAHPRLTACAGDAMHLDSVSQAVAGHEVVVITLGAGASRRSRVRSQGTRNVIEAMQRCGVNRLVCQTTLGAGESWSNLNFFWKYVMFGLLLRPVFLDHEHQEQLVRDSGLDWTIVRPSAFTDEPTLGALKVDIPVTERGLGLKISRAEIAAFLTRCVSEGSFMHRAVGISH